MIVEWTETDSPVGRLTLAARDGRLLALTFDGLWPRGRARIERYLAGCRFVRRDDPAGAATQLRRYFDGERGALEGLDVEMLGTAFQKSVWQQLRSIPAGQTRTYSQIAEAVGVPAAVRAVGAANGANPVGIVVPCHRVVGRDGSLTGFAGGLGAKRWLLDHESAQLRMPRASAAA